MGQDKLLSIIVRFEVQLLRKSNIEIIRIRPEDEGMLRRGKYYVDSQN